MFIFIMLLGITLVSLSGCSTTQKGAGLGAVAGAGLGAIVGHQSGETAKGAVVGGLGGAAAGALIGEQMDKKFCPVDGKRFTSGAEYCPEHGAELKVLKK